MCSMWIWLSPLGLALYSLIENQVQQKYALLRDFEAVDLYIDVVYLTFKGEAIEAVILKLLYINYHMLKPLGCAIMSF